MKEPQSDSHNIIDKDQENQMFDAKKCSQYQSLSHQQQKGFNDCTKEDTNFQVQTQSSKLSLRTSIKTNNKVQEKQKQQIKQDRIRVSVKNQSQIINAEQQQSLEQFSQTLYKLQVNQWVVDVVERNQTYSCNFIHFLIPYCFVILELYCYHRHKHIYLMQVFQYILKRLVKTNIAKQIQQKDYNSYRNIDKNSVRAMMKEFLTKQSKLTQVVCPYYYNLFAMVFNKQIIFSKEKDELLPYTVSYSSQSYEKFTEIDVKMELQKIELAMVQKYHSPNI